MLIAKNDEAKRSRIWRNGMIISSIIIVLVAIYLLIKVLNENPVVGKWMDDDGNYRVHFLNNGKVYVTNFSEDEEAEELELRYKLDKESRIVAISSDEKALENIMEVNESEYLEEEFEAELSDQTVMFYYSVDSNEMILTECDYGEQMILIKE